MSYLFGFIFLLLGIWQLIITWRTFTGLKKDGDKSTSPFIMLGLWNSLVFAIIFIAVSLTCFFINF